LNGSTQELYKQSAARVKHLEDLYTIPSLADVKYEEWSRIRLDRLLVDYLLRMGYTESAKALAQEKGVKELVDCDAFEQCGKVEQSLRVERRVEPALAWCNENKGTLKKMGNNTFEFELRLQQYIELARAGHRTGELKKFNDATAHAKKYLASHPDPEWKQRAATLLAIPPDDSDGGDEMEVEDPYSVRTHAGSPIVLISQESC
jgi:macrophage erythroblast attacher